MMAPETQSETQSEMLNINVKLLSGLASLGVFAIGVIAWGVRLECRTETNSDNHRSQALEMNAMRSDRLRDNDRITRAESSLTFILDGISEIKQMLKAKP